MMSILIESTSGTFVEFRNGMINVSPIGRNATCASRDPEHKIDISHEQLNLVFKNVMSLRPMIRFVFSLGSCSYSS
jgi:phosphomannomutase